MNRTLKSLRIRFGDTQQNLAEFLGIGINTYNFKENGKNAFTLEEARKISLKYNMPMEEIFFDKEVVNVTTESIKLNPNDSLCS